MTSIQDRLAAALADRYRIERELGAGGMATVYLAHDLKHNRHVALKVLKPELAAILGAERFLGEIRTTANLQHPHILALFDSGHIDGIVFYVMPFVSGESLRDRLKREQQLPVEDALRIAREVGDALQHAHSRGVIHRDIKPENILLQGGHALVADFGIALAAAHTGGSRMTETGMSLGTPTYMSPEQAMGERSIDGRTDVYALGCVLYEMLVGDPPHSAGTAQAIVAKVLTEKPASIVAQRPRVPPHVEDAVFTALEKLPADRFASAADFVAALAPDGVTTARRTVRNPASRPRPHARAPLIALGIGLVALAAFGGWYAGHTATAPPSGEPSRLALLEPGANLAFNGVARTIDISADGQVIVYVADHPLGHRVMARRLDGSTSTLLPINTSNAHLRLSRDGRFLYSGFVSGGMSRIAIAGGASTPVAALPGTSFLAIAEDSTLWWGAHLGVGTFRRGADGRDSLVFPRSTINQVLPGGRYALGIGLTTASNGGTPQLMNLRTGMVTDLFATQVVEVRYALGHLLYVRPDNALLAVPFDAGSGRVTGMPVEIATNVSVSGIGFAQIGVSDNGTVAYIPSSDSDLVRVERNGQVRVLLDERRRYHSPRISPEGRRIAFDDVSSEGRDVYILADGQVTRATVQRDGHDAVWALDGRGLFYLAGSGGRLDVFRLQLGSTTAPQAVGTPVEVAHTGTPLSDGGLLTTVTGRSGRGLDVVRLSADAASVDTLLATDADETYVVPSPDGRWFAYVSDHTGRTEVYLRALTGSNVQLQVSADGANEPVWSRNGSEIYYRRPTATGSELVAAALQFGVEPRVLSRTSLFDVSNYDTAAPHANYDVSPDGRWFVFARRGSADHIVVLQNVPELARRMARGTGSNR
jgi:eukaryotic-like serine/threonine-protein kinase